MEQQWLTWARKLSAIAQTGLTFNENDFDRERYEAVRTIAAEMTAAESFTDKGELDNVLEGQEGYATPKIDVRGVVFRDDKILLVKEKSDGGWTLPGGWADVGETASQSVVKEIREESGYEAKASKILAVYDRRTQNHPPQFFDVYKLYILCEIVGGEAVLGTSETDDVAFFAEDSIPALSLLRVMPQQISRMFEHHRNPDLPTDFD